MLLMLEFLCLVSFVEHKFQTNKLCAEQWHNDTVFSRVMFEFESLSILNFFFFFVDLAKFVDVNECLFFFRFFSSIWSFIWFLLSQENKSPMSVVIFSLTLPTQECGWLWIFYSFFVFGVRIASRRLIIFIPRSDRRCEEPSGELDTVRISSFHISHAYACDSVGRA